MMVSDPRSAVETAGEHEREQAKRTYDIVAEILGEKRRRLGVSS